MDGSGAQRCGHAPDGAIFSESHAISSDIIRQCRILSN
ncbi:hypothetical protein C791_7351 [Amycolatopsis azurea DSM 43854]|uniref:Uncharacterized protein n=1 Tax=Amycolatopsis azurea DSM 43854 TaxID=1238180 RepID=M2Q991_9PSEU|nr:hypothetical protein C791_7351 [Amycolatopsis azurea DSM 43854]